MNTRKSRSRTAFVSRLMALAMCATTLLGSTYAWFTATTTTNVNKIVSGTLDVQLVDANGNDLEGETLNFQPSDGRTTILWEPNATYNLQNVYVKNNGNLALKYRIEVSKPAAVPGSVNLQDVIEFTVNDGTEDLNLATYQNSLLPGEQSSALTISGHMDKNAGNEYMNQTLENVAITIYATQFTAENDSFGNTYDAEASLDFVNATTAEDLAIAIAAGHAVELGADVTMPEQIEVIRDVEIRGNGYTLTAPAGGTRIINATGNDEDVTVTMSGVNLAAENAERAFSAYSNAGKLNLVMTGCTAAANNYALNIAADNAEVNVTVKGSTIEGWCAFQTHSANTTATFEDCVLIGNNDKPVHASNAFGTIVVNENASNAKLIFDNCRIEANTSSENLQYHFIDKTGTANVEWNNCTYFVNGVQVSELSSLIY